MSNPMDKIFREKLGRYKAPVKQDLWAAIAADQAAKRRSARYRKFFLYGAASLLLLLTGAMAAYFWGTSVAESPSEPLAETTEQAQEITADTPPSSTADSATEATTDLLVTANVPPATSSVISLNESSRTSDDSSYSRDDQANDNPVPLASETTTQDMVQSTDENPESLGITTTIPGLPLPLLSPRQPALPRLEVQALEEQTSGFTPTSRKRFSVDLLLGPAYANQQFELADESHRDLLNAREISEFPEVSIMAGLRLGFHLKGRWSLRSGLLYTQIRNQFEYEQDSNNPDQQPILIKSSNQIRLLEIPLLASYELPGRRFHLAINAGPVLNLSTSANGRYLLPDLMEPISLEEDNIYRNNIGLSYQASLSAAYDLGMGNSLLIEPTFRTYRSSFTRNSYDLDERYWLVGLQVGLRHRLR